jgi:2-polyprenyl-3-methyl-5-hydroxy-6-metoxy-1,4-benzoquinol methylase
MKSSVGRDSLDVSELHRREAAFFDDHARTSPVDISLPIKRDTLFPYVSRAGSRAIETFLGDVSGKRVLDCGCGTGFATVLFARKGARVTAFDISSQYVELARRRIEHNAVQDQIDWLGTMGLETIEFPDESFDIVYGGHILHHTRLDRSVPQVARVLRDRGKGVFIETLATNRLLMWTRANLAGRCGLSKLASESEYPLRGPELDDIAARFSSFRLRGDILFAMLARYVFRGRRAGRFLRAADACLFERFPGAARLAYGGILFLKK